MNTQRTSDLTPDTGLVTKLDFVHIGFHRCASTTLQTDIFGGDRRIACTKSHQLGIGEERRISAIRWFAGRRADEPGIKRVGVSSEALCGVDYEKQGRGSLFFAMPSAIHRAWPETRILIIIRRQPELIKSYYTLALRKTLVSASLRDYAAFMFGRDQLDYAVLVDRYLKLFGQDRVTVLPFELLLMEPKEFVARLSLFVGIDLSSVSLRRRNAGGALPGNFVLRYVNRALGFTKNRNSFAAPKTHLRNIVDRVVPVPRLTLPENLVREISQHYRESNRLCGELIGFDLVNEFGY